ncbi:hypothetical protein GCM10010833_08860 [Blastomonas aquatica]|uniref:Uncharacterized protein n=1 Tax=Blastomonas aquatica TaxID=1510276 RepID=A0ABQ1J2Q2_9SPHN|nr:hypothetical protein GCM10010833_08860 [Blastomonas aquatica]
MAARWDGPNSGGEGVAAHPHLVPPSPSLSKAPHPSPPNTPVMLNSFQHPSRVRVRMVREKKWPLNQSLR